MPHAAPAAAAPPPRRGRSSSPGPATATSAMPRRGSRNFHADTGTGLAQPNMNTTRWMVSKLEDQQEAGQQDGAHAIDMAQRIERQPPGPPRGVVAQRQRRVAVRRLVQGDRQDRRDHRQGELKDDVGHASSRSRSAARAVRRPAAGAVARRAPGQHAKPRRGGLGQRRAARQQVGGGRRARRCNTARRRSRPPAPAAPDRRARRPAPSWRGRRSPELLRSRSGRG